VSRYPDDIFGTHTVGRLWVMSFQLGSMGLEFVFSSVVKQLQNR
jgi:hypothetical protein